MTINNSEIKIRVEREKISHTQNDVLGNSYRLKSFFAHTISSPTIRRLEGDFSSHLNNVQGARLLDIGCGHGGLSLSLLGKGAAYVAGIDISQTYVDDAIRSAGAANYASSSFEFLVMDAHNLEFADDHFDMVVGNGILHHLDLPTCLNEINRVLKPGGFALFIEPLAGNPFLKLFRLLTPKARTVDEKPLDSSDLIGIEKKWYVQSRYYGMLSAPVAVLTSVLLRPFPNNIFLIASDWFERRLNKYKIFHSYNQYVLLILVKH